MKKCVYIMTITLLLTFCAGGAFAASPANSGQLERHAWQGEINNKIPVSVWFEIRGDLIVGELVYTNTKEKKPIRLLGTIGSDGNLSIREMLPDGLVSGFINGKIVGDNFEGVWKAPDKLAEKGGSYEGITGKSYPLRLSKAPLPPTSFPWEHSSNTLAGEYRYSHGKDQQYGVATLSGTEGGGMEFTITSYTAAPAYNEAYLSFSASASGEGKSRLQGNRVLYEADESCAVEILLFSDFLVTRYIERKHCSGWFGMNATIEGMFVKQNKK